MAVSTLYHPPHHKGALTKFWLAIIILIAAGVALAWFGAGALRGTTTSSGLVFRTVQAGAGPVITSNDAVLIDYEGRLQNGTVFDSSSNHGGPQAVAPAQVIPGFGEALTMMQKGGRYHIVIPPKLGYGEASPPGIPPNSTLEFDIHVVDVAPGAAAMAAQAQEQQRRQEESPQQAPQQQPQQ
jgi:FKBP-type peptidyl-prolyl cis-trans isomerase FkpA